METSCFGLCVACCWYQWYCYCCCLLPIQEHPRTLKSGYVNSSDKVAHRLQNLPLVPLIPWGGAPVQSPPGWSPVSKGTWNAWPIPIPSCTASPSPNAKPHAQSTSLLTSVISGCLQRALFHTVMRATHLAAQGGQASSTGVSSPESRRIPAHRCTPER